MKNAFPVIAVGLLVAVVGCKDEQAQPSSKTRIRIGWQTEWATQGQLVQILKRTNILDRHGLACDFHAFSYGGPLNEAALAGEVDVVLTADQPAVALIARMPDWHIVARLIDFRACLIVPPESQVKRTADLRGKTVAVPFGSTTHRIALAMLEQAGLTPGKDVDIRNLDILEQSALAQTSSGGRWGAVDAMAAWDPTVALLEFKTLARVIEVRPAIGVVVMSESFLREHSEAAIRFLKAFRLAYAYYATHEAQADRWYLEATKTPLPLRVLDVAAAFEPNLKAKSVDDIRIALSDANLAAIQEGADFALSQKLITYAPKIQRAVDQSFLSSAMSSPELMTLGDVRER